MVTLLVGVLGVAGGFIFGAAVMFLAIAGGE
nr:MAG TPA: G-rich domain on putative tyrosine kinase [Caudoviricetes sp.]